MYSKLMGQTTVTYTQQTANYYAGFNTGAGTGVFNQGSFQLGMFANTSGAKQAVSWRKFRTDASGVSTSDRSMQVGDVFVITLSATRAYGKMGFALLASPAAVSGYADRENNYAISFNLDGPLYLGGATYGNWYAKYNGGTTSTGSANVAGQQTTYKDITFTLTLTAPDRMNATWTDGTTTSNLYDILLNTANPITDYSVFLEDDWDGAAQRNVYWGLGAVGTQHTLTNNLVCTLGQSNSSFTEATVISNGLAANSSSTSSVNSLIKMGSGLLTLSASNSYSGNTTTAAGTLQLGAAGVVPDASNMVLNGGTLSSGAAAGFSETMGTLTMSANTSLSLGTGAHSLNFANSNAAIWTAGATLSITGWAGAYNGTAGTAGRIFIGSSSAGLTASQLLQIVFVNGGNTYTATLLGTGELVPVATQALFWGGTAAQILTTATWGLVNGGPYGTVWNNARTAIFNVPNSTITGATSTASAYIVNENVTFTSGGSLFSGSAVPVYVTSGKLLNFGGQNFATAAGTGIIKNGLGAMYLTGNAYKVFILNEGLVVAKGVSAMGSGGTLTINGGTIGADGPTDFTNKFTGGITVGGDFTFGSAANPSVITANLTFTNTISLGSSVTRTITLGGTGTYNLNGVINGTGSNLVLNAIAAGTLSLGALNTYGGNTTINGGTLRITIADALPTTTGLSLANVSGAIFNLNNLAQTITSLSGGGTTGGNITTGSGTLTLNQASNTTYSGLISGTGSIIKSGTGILTFANAANAYTGTTTINAGELRLNPASTTASFASKLVLNGGKLSTTGITGNTIFTSSSTLDLNASSTIDLGANVHSLKFANSSGISWAGSTLTIYGWTGTPGVSGTAGKIFFGSVAGTLTDPQLAKITFSGYTGTPVLLSTGELVPGITYTWAGATDAFWTTATNWSPNGIPGLADNVIINIPGANTLTITGTQSVNNLSLTGTGMLIITSTGVLNTGGNLTSTSSAATPLNADCISTVNFVSTGTQTIPAFNYGNLNTTGGPRVLASGGTIGVCTLYTPVAATTITGSTVSFNGTVAQSIPNAHAYETLRVADVPSNTNLLNTDVTTVNLVIDAGARLNITGTKQVNVTGATASTIDGIIRRSNTGVIFNFTTTPIFSATGEYEHDCDGGSIISAVWSAGSPGATCTIFNGDTTLAPGNLGQAFYNFTWNSTQKQDIGLNGALTTVNGKFSVSNTGIYDLRLTTSSTNATLTVGANMILNGGSLNLTSGSSSSTINLKGALQLSTGSLKKSGSGTAFINLNGTLASQNITKANVANLTGDINFRFNNPIGVNIATSSLLPINANAALYITNGPITGAGTVTYASSSVLVYDPAGSTAITTTNREWPATGGPSNVTINSTSSSAVTLHAARTVTGVLTFTAGRLALGTYDLTVSNNAVAAVTSAGGYSETNGTGSLVRTILSSTNNNYIFPVGNSTNYTPVSYFFATNSLAGRTLSVRSVEPTHPNMSPNPASYISNRYWITNLNDASGTYSYTPSHTFISPADPVGTLANIRLSRWNGTLWTNMLSGTTSGAIMTTSAPLTEGTGNLSNAQWSGRAAIAPGTYTWTGAVDNSWIVTGNWSPAGIPNSGDAVIFNNSVLVTNTVTGITLTSLKVLSGTIRLKSTAAGAINIGGGTNPVVAVAAGSTLILDGDNTINLKINTGSTGIINGNFQLEGDISNTANHTFEAADAAGITFNNGSYCSAGLTGTTNFNGNPFGNSGTSNTVVFSSGSVFEHFDGGNPFGLTQPASKVVFQTGSLYKYSNTDASAFAVPSLSGRSYANFEYNIPGTKSPETGTTAWTMGNVAVTQGTFNLNLATSATANILGNISVNSSAALSFSPPSASAIQLNGAAAQTITGTGTFTLGANATVNVTNTTGVSLQKNMINNGSLNVVSPAILHITDENTISGSGTFTLNSGGTLGIGSANGITSGGTGNVQTTTRSYSSGANYTYNGPVNQSTGNFTTAPTPNTVNTFTMANTGTSPADIVTLTTNNTTVNNLILSAGRFAAGAGQTLKIATSGIVNGNGYLSNLGNQYIAGAAGGTIEFSGSGTVNGIPELYNITLNGSVNFANNARINSQLLLNTGSFVNPNAPKYAAGSTLIYNTGGTYNRSIEWGQATPLAAGYPHHIRVQNSTTLNLGTVVPPALQTGGDLTIGTSSNGSNIVTLNALTIPLKILGNLVIGDPLSSGNRLTLSTAIGGDLELSGDFTRYLGTNYFDNSANDATPHPRAVFFKGALNTAVNAPLQKFHKLLMQKTGSGDLTLNCPVTIESAADFATGKINTGTVNILTFEEAAVVAGTPGSSSYINGPAAKQYASAGAEFTFPVGKASATPVYNPCGVKPVSIASLTTFGAEYFIAPDAQQGAMLVNLAGMIQSGYWDISNSLSGASTARVKLYYTNPGAGNWIYYNGSGTAPFYDPAPDPCTACNVAVVHRDGTNNWNFTSTAGMFDGSWPEFRYYTDQGFVYSTVQSNFSPFSFGYSYNVVLPVRLVSFAGKSGANNSLLNWELASQPGLAGLELQYSRNGRSFSKLVEMPVTTAVWYHYLHRQLPEGNHFYRLLIKEKNGRSFYSQIVLLTQGKVKTQIIGLANNPVTAWVTPVIFSAVDQQVAATILDAAGKLIYRREGRLKTGENQWQIPAAALPSKSLYFITITTADGVKTTLRFLKF